ncbi:MAG: DUF484 family protein [gamma proteobacterium symbiont of Bathyaustriella thionipta]|nr:DUF484 family protein [gamma proteobacterium symbiont of Bathyaustriella thionipta]MCU7950122.1 DUF484 family protein [gamma proteobacterium symbiont of Bathyaustriella thionipta]MCU7954558.1 DUF484 family protein [gamma proteobacterium symbiont of Bathyaustriella thionipta]MCU7957190.1 DUF484 family protein [gamma proteobacterium symbiont of Bathyaustriella thionipta]MCU7968450.1 DUF484 family protein [gamma proteobacterium symbiont of Bathyaustriella thionipta]
MNSGSELESETMDTTEQQAQAQTDKTQEIIDYLTANPEFFNQNTDFLASLEIPHSSGTAVSLIERQVSILREQNQQHKEQLTELFDIAKENEQSNQQMHKLTLSLLSSEGIDACEVIINESLCDEFSVDAVALKLFTAPISDLPEHLFVEKNSVLALELDKILNTRKPMCGFFKQLPLDILFESKSASLASLAVIPLFIEKNNCFGALILGSNNVRHFNADMGTVFLERLGEILSHRLNRFIKQADKA